MKLVPHGFDLALIDAGGVRHESVRPIRLFPLTDPQHWISLVDAKGRELACISDVGTLDEEQRKLLRAGKISKSMTVILT